MKKAKPATVKQLANAASARSSEAWARVGRVESDMIEDNRVTRLRILDIESRIFALCAWCVVASVAAVLEGLLIFRK